MRARRAPHLATASMSPADAGGVPVVSTTPEVHARHVALAVVAANVAIIGATAGLLLLGPPWTWSVQP